MPNYINDIYKLDTEKGTIRVCEDGLRVRNAGGTFYHYEWDELFGLRTLRQSVKRLNEKGIDINSDIRLEYPLNLFNDMGIDLDEPKFEYGEQYYLDKDKIVNDFDYNLSNCNLTPKEENALRFYYKSMMTLEEVGKEFCVARERARQIISKALRRLRTPRNLNKLLEIHYIDYARAVNTAIEKATDEYIESHKDEIMEKLPSEIKRFYDEWRRDERQREILERELLARKTMMLKIEELDLSVRSYNCLKRYGIETVKDLILCIKRGDAWKIRNLGKKSYKEIIDRIVDEGYITKRNYDWHCYSEIELSEDAKPYYEDDGNGRD